MRPPRSRAPARWGVRVSWPAPTIACSRGVSSHDHPGGIDRRIARAREQVAEVDVQMIVGGTAVLTVRSRPRARQHAARYGAEALDRFAVVEEDVTDSVD